MCLKNHTEHAIFGPKLPTWWDIHGDLFNTNALTLIPVTETRIDIYCYGVVALFYRPAYVGSPSSYPQSNPVLTQFKLTVQARHYDFQNSLVLS